MQKWFLFFFVLFTSVTFAQDLQSYQLYTSKGKKISFKKMVKTASDKDVTLFGELHNNAIAHWLQLELVKALNENQAIAIGAEMIEADNQDELDDYLSTIIDAKAFDTLARLWSNYDTDYRPVVDFALENKLPFIATNVPRRYASLVYKKGFEALDSLSNEEKAWIAPLPILYDPTLPGYQKMKKMMRGHSNDNFPKAQAIKDATMAHFMYQEMKRTGNLFVHLNGRFHSDNFDGIYWYLKKLDDTMQIVTISTVLQSDVTQLSEENEGVADFILVVDEDVTSTYR
jgi:uncharacterized iron-regulated protein